MDVASKIRTALAIEMLEYENMNLLSGDNKTRCEEKMRLLREALADIEGNGARVPGRVPNAFSTWVYTIAPGEVVVVDPTMTKEQAAVVIHNLTAALQTSSDLAKRLATDALVALAGAGICTPEHGYLSEPVCLRSDIERLARERDEARESLSRVADQRLQTAEQQIQRNEARQKVVEDGNF